MVRLQLFGPPIIQHIDEVPSPFKSRKVEALLYFLALAPGQYRRTYLANLLWSEWSEEKALGNLRYALWNLRQVLGEEIVSGDRLNITFQERPAIWSDVSAFRELFHAADAHPKPHAPEVIAKLQQAVDLYRGDFLASFEVGEAPFFQEWLQQQRTTLHDLAVRCLIHLGTYYASYHYLPEAITTTRRLLDMEPWREEAHRQMMRLLALAGRRNAALAHYQQCCQILAAELDLEPEPQTVALMERIRAGELELAPEDNPTKLVPEVSALAFPLFGRHSEYAWLVERWDIARRGRSRLVLIRGEAGVGKTRLAEELGHLVLSQGGLVLRGRCYEFSGPVPYQPIAAALQQQIARHDARDLPLSEAWLVELAQLLPEVRQRYVHLPPSPSTGQSTDRYRLFEAVSHFLQALTLAQPTLFFLDDLHWADSDTLDMLGYLLRRLTGSPLLIVGAYRPGEVVNDHALVALDRPLLNDGFNEELELDRLSKETVQQMAQSIALAADSDRLAGFLYRLSEGNPFMLFEALNEMHEHGWLQPTAEGPWALKAAPLDQEELISDEVQARIRRRVARLAPASRSLLALAAVIGRPFEARLLQAASGDSPEHVLSCLDDWLARHLMKEVLSGEQGAWADVALARGECHYDFSHDLIRAVVYADLSQARRQIMHTKLGDALELVYAGQIDQVVEWLAHHYHYGYRPQKALRYLQQAGQQAQTVYALPLAQERYRRALSYWERLYSLTDTALPTEAWRQRWRLLLSQAEVSRMLGQIQAEPPTLEIVLHEVSHWGDDQDRLQVIEQQIARLEQTTDLDQRRQLAQEGLRLARLLGQPLAEGNFLQALADCERDMANFEQALSHYEAALISFSHLEQTRLAAFCLIRMGTIHLLHNRYAQAQTHFCQAKSYAETRGYQDALIWSYNAIAQMHLFLGGLEEAQRLSQEALALCELIGFDSGASTGLQIQGYIHMLGGRLAQAQAQYERAWAINQGMGQTLRMADVQCCMGNLCLLRGEAERAITHYKQAEALCGSYYSGRAIEARSQRAMAHLALRQLAEALHCSAHAVIWLSRYEQNMLAPQRVYLNQYHVLLAQGEMEEAQDALVHAYTIVQAQARGLAELYAARTDYALIRERFLSDLPWNREIMEIWESLPLSSSVTVLRSLHGYPG
ncbi:AAA family ATPase [Chloroflexales bacterium ZM16-3]|nr:AAA family ATPase [Chloroflexales bacterium ZM16-3]